MASELTAARREVMMASYKVDVIQRQVGDLQKQVAGAQDQMHRIEALLQSLVNPQARILDQTVGRGAPNLRPSKEPRNLPDLVQQTEVEIEMTGRIDELRRITLNSTQGKQWMGAPEGNFNPPSTGYSAVPSGWGQNQLLPACLVSHNLNNLNPSHGPELARQCPQYPRELRNQSQFQYQARQWDPNLSKERVLSVSTVDADLPSFINMTIEQMEQTTVKATSYTVDGHNVDWKSHQILDRTKDEAHFHMKQGAFLYNLEVKTLPKSHHCFFIRLTLEYFKFSSLDSYEFSACKFNNPKHRHYVILSKNIIAASVVTIIEEYFSSGNGNEARNAELGSNGAEKCDIEPSGSADAAASIVAEEEHNFEPVCSEQEKVQAMDVEKSNGEDMPLKKSTFSYTDEVKERFNRILKYYVGTHNFHNFTTRTKAEDPAAKRFIISFTADRVVSLDGIDFVRCEVVWQSFMLHQIRKMIGLAVAVMRNGAPEPIYDVAFRRDVNLNVPTALEVGLYLDEPSGANGDVQEDEHDKLRSLKELGFPEYNPIFINKLITIAMDRKNREKEMASVLLSSLSMELFSTEAIVKGFIMLLESTEDTALDILDASDELGLFLAVAKRSVESAQLKKIRLIMMPLRQVPSRSRNIALSSSCLSTWHYLLYKLGDLINHLSILEAAFVPVLKIIFSTGLDNANKPLWSFCINLFHDFISVKFRHMASPGEYLCIPLNQNLLSQSCMHLKALLDVQHIKWLPWDVTSFDFQLEILGSIVNPELLQNMTHEMAVIVMDSATQIFRLLLQGVRVDCKAKFAYNNIQICITKACQFVKKVFLDLVGKQNSDSCAVLVQFGLQFMKVTAEELDHSLLASEKYEICLDIEHIKEMQYAECSPKISYPEIRPLSYMEMVSPAVYMTAVSLSMVAQFTGELSHGHADQLALVFCSSDFPENFHAAVAFLYMQILRPVDNRLRIKWLMVWNKIAKRLNEQIIPYLKFSFGASGRDILYQFFCYPFFAFLCSGRISTLWNAQNSSESYLPVAQDLEEGLVSEVYRSLCANSNCRSEATYKDFLERFYEYLISIIDENMSSFQANLEYFSEKKFKNITILSAVGEVVIGLLENARILNYANHELKETSEESVGCGQPNLFLSCLKLVNRFMRLSRFGFKANPAEQHQVTSRFFSSLSTFVGHLILKKDILLLFEIIGDQLTEWLSLSGTLYSEMQQGETIDKLEKLWLNTVDCLKMSQLISDGSFLQKQHLLFQAAVDHPHYLISVATISIWRALRSGNTSLQHSGCSVSKLDKVLMDRRKGLDASSDADRAIALEELDISRKFALPTSEKRIITSNSTEHTDRNGESSKISVGMGKKRLKIMKYSTKPKELCKNTVHSGGFSSKADTGAFSPHHVESKVCRKPELILEMLKRKR